MTIFEKIKRQLGQFSPPELTPIVPADEKPFIFKETLNEPVKHSAPFSGAPYTHGLEDIYSIEKIDLGSIRKIGEGEKKEKKESGETCKRASNAEHRLNQFELDLDGEYRESLPSFACSVLLSCLKIKKETLKILKRQGYTRVSDLMAIDWSACACSGVLGQGHIDEVKEALANFLDGRELSFATSVDFFTLVLRSIESISSKEAFLILEKYGLENLVVLSTAERVELRRLSQGERQRLVEQIKQKLLNESDQGDILESIAKVHAVFLKPWMRQRAGIAREYEVLERLLAIGENGDKTLGCLRYFADLFYGGEYAFYHDLAAIDDELLCVDSDVLSRYQQISRCAESYFHRGSDCYALDALIGFVCRELARCWIYVEELFIEKTIRCNSRFFVFRSKEGKRFVEIA